MFCREIVRADIEYLKKTPCLNAYLGLDPSAVEELVDGASDGRITKRVEGVFGKLYLSWSAIGVQQLKLMLRMACFTLISCGALVPRTGATVIR